MTIHELYQELKYAYNHLDGEYLKSLELHIVEVCTAFREHPLAKEIINLATEARRYIKKLDCYTVNWYTNWQTDGILTA